MTSERPRAAINDGFLGTQAKTMQLVTLQQFDRQAPRERTPR